jgi:hypothetical protein
MTLKGETFATCLDCGGRVPYSLDALRAGMPCKKVVGKVPVPKQPGTRINSAPINSTLRKWTREGVWLGLGLLAAGFAGGIFYPGRQPAGSDNRATFRAPRTPKAEVMAIPAALPDAPDPMPPPSAEVHQPNQMPRLESDGRMVVLAHEAAAALEIAQHPGKLPDLIQSGSLFSVSRGTPVRIVEKQRTLVDVVITGGPMAGQKGWVAAARVAW